MAEIKLREHPCYGFRVGCVICGQVFEQDGVAAMLMMPGADKRLGIGDVCPECLDAGPKGAAERARGYAVYLRERAGKVDDLAVLLEDVPFSAWATSKQVKDLEDEGDRRIDLAQAQAHGFNE